MGTILIIEDDIALNKGVEFALRKEGYNVIKAYTKKSGEEIIIREKIDLLLLDINLPDGNGLDLCRSIRNIVTFPIVFLTANDTEEDMIKGFENGCDDYLPKPFSLSILKYKVNAILRRKIEESKDLFLYKDLKIDFVGLHVEVRNTEVKLTNTEYKLLELLAKNKGKIMTKEILLDKLWDSKGNFVDENTLTVNIRRLRKKLEVDPKNPIYIRTIFGIGYVMGV